jgi:sugar porter (SP) family MFS transporter
MAAVATEKSQVKSQHESAAYDESPSDSLRGVAALQYAIAHEPVSFRESGIRRLCGICLTMFLGATILGYDASLMGVLLALPAFKAQFGTEIVGAQTGLLTAMFAIGGVCALPFIGPLADTWGRRLGIMIGCFFLVIGAIIQGTSKELPQYLAGRFFLGFGGGVAHSVSAYIVEIAHPAYRGTMAGLFNCFYYVGSFLAAIVLRGCLHYGDNKSWIIPTWLQIVLPAFVFICCPFFPESPRWLFTHNKPEQCRDILAKYHGNGSKASLYVTFQMREFQEQLELQGADKRWWDYRCLFNSRSTLYRVIVCAAAVPALSQWTGQAGVSYFLPGILQTMNITDPERVMNINIGIAVASGGCAIIGASLLDRFGRRPMLISCCIGLVLAWVGTIVATQRFTIELENKAAAQASLAFIFLVTMTFSFAYTPLQQLYPVECLGYEQRAKGVAFASMCTSATALVNLFATPIALEYIQWKTYGIWIATCSLQAVYYYFFMVETKGRTLEEMNYIFAQKNPRAASLRPAGSVGESAIVAQRDSKEEM